MKVVILAGGLGTRLSDSTESKPKPLVEIGGKPIIWHIMKIYAAAGFKDFIVCCGYKAAMLKSYFTNYFLENYDIEVDLGTNKVKFLGSAAEDWTVTLIDTGIDTMTGGRIRRIADRIAGGPFCLTYGDGVADLDINAVVAHHRRSGRLATVTAVPSPGRFGVLGIDDGDRVSRFQEKPDNEAGWINGGFFVLEPGVVDYIEDDATVWEHGPLMGLSRDGQLTAYRHEAFWRPMDTPRDHRELEQLWNSGRAPWKRW